MSRFRPIGIERNVTGVSLIRFFLALSFVSLTGALQTSPALATCSDESVILEVLGSGGPEYDDGRISSSYIVRRNGAARILVDIGPGASIAFGQADARFEDLDAVLLTHLHVDHAGDLPAFIKGSYFSDRERDLPLFGPAGNALMPATTDFVARLLGDDGAYRYLQDYVSSDRRSDYKLRVVDVPLVRGDIERIELGDDTEVSATHVHHGPVAAVAWRVDVGDCSIAFSGDMSNRFGTLAALARDVDILVMDNAVPEDAGRVARNLHMTPSEIGRIAHAARARRVVLSHFMRRTQNRQQETLDAIRQHFEGPIELAEDGRRIVP